MNRLTVELSRVDMGSVFNVPKSERVGRPVRRPMSRWRTIDGERLTPEQVEVVSVADLADWGDATAVLQSDAAQARMRGEWWHELDDLLAPHWDDGGQIVDALSRMTPDDYARAVELLGLCGILHEEASDGS